MAVDGALARLRDAVLLITSDLSLHTMLEHIARAACEMVDARYAALGVIGRDGALSDFVHCGVDEATARRIGHLPEGRGLLGTLISDPRPLRLEDLHAHPDSVGFPAHHPPMDTFLGVPIHVRDRIYGNLYLTERADNRPFDEDDERMIEALAAVAGAAINTARAHTRHANVAVLEERERIGRELHDMVMQQLFATGLELQMVAGQLEPVDPTNADRVEKAVENLNHTIREIRTTIFSLQDLDAEDADSGVSVTTLEQEVSDVVREASRPLGFTARRHFRTDYDGLIAHEQVSHLLGAVREGLTNVARHANATACEVDLLVDNGEIVLLILDNGRGVDVRHNRAGYGLRNLERRAREMDGTSRLHPDPEGGARLEWRVPILPPE